MPTSEGQSVFLFGSIKFKFILSILVEIYTDSWKSFRY